MIERKQTSKFISWAALAAGIGALGIGQAMLQNKDIGFVAVGQSVEIKIDTFNFAKYGLLHGTVLSVSPADFGRHIADETEKWGKVIRAANIKPE